MKILDVVQGTPEWHAGRIRRDGYDPKDVPVSRIHNYRYEEEEAKA